MGSVEQCLNRAAISVSQNSTLLFRFYWHGIPLSSWPPSDSIPGWLPLIFLVGCVGATLQPARVRYGRLRKVKAPTEMINFKGHLDTMSLCWNILQQLVFLTAGRLTCTKLCSSGCSCNTLMWPHACNPTLHVKHLPGQLPGTRATPK